MLRQTLLRTDDVPPAERFGFWRQCTVDTIAPMDVTSDHATDYWGHMRLLHLDAVTVWPVAMQASRYVRTPRLIRRSDPELYHLTLVLPGSSPIGVTQAGRGCATPTGGLYVLDVSRPFEVHAADSGRPLVGIGVEIPKSMVPLPKGTAVDQVLGRSLSGGRGFGSLLGQFLRHLSGQRDAYRPSDAAHLNSVLCDLVAGLITSALPDAPSLDPDVRARNLVRSVGSFIEQHLADPRLTPRTLAEAHHMSVRQLHRLFERQGTTVAALVRRRRLERARRDLADPAHRDTPIGVVAARCGFTAAAHFSRAFHAAYGVSPREYRVGRTRAL
ncbi:helix-turn-helix domain-containing protein [Streptomyces thermolilacinus]|uniref:helix-turn-helix domain-containing protein n=1 Tax=Streptomyces thermolilacinus TaxID=285540 RepID=UPI0033E2A818